MSKALALLVATLALPAFGADPNAPQLLFNWTLRAVDAPLELTGFTRAGNQPDSPVTKSASSSSMGMSVQYVGSGISFNGVANSYSRTGSDGLPEYSATADITNDPTWDDKDRELMGPVSDAVLWQRTTPRFQEYTMALNAYYGNWTLNNVDIMTGMNSTAASLAEVPTRTENFIMEDGTINKFYNTTGRWEHVKAGNDLPDHAKCFDDAMMRVAIPPKTAYLVINGTRTRQSKNLYFVLESADGAETYSQSIDVAFPDPTEALLYMRPLNPRQTYTLIVTCVFTGSQGENGFTSMTFYEGTTDDKGNDGGNSNNNGGNTNTNNNSGNNAGNTNSNNSGGTAAQPSGNPGSPASMLQVSGSGVVASVALALFAWL